MKRVSLMLASLAVSVLAVPVVAQSADEAEIRSVAMRQGETWSRHDAKAYAALFTDDVAPSDSAGAFVWTVLANVGRIPSPLR